METRLAPHQTPNLPKTYGFAPETIPFALHEPKVGLKVETKRAAEKESVTMFRRAGAALMRFMLGTPEIASKMTSAPRSERAQHVMPVGGMIEAPPILGQAPRPQAEVSATSRTVLEAQPTYYEAEEIRNRVGVDIPRSTTAEYRGRLVGDDTPTETQTDHTPESKS